MEGEEGEPILGFIYQGTVPKCYELNRASSVEVDRICSKILMHTVVTSQGTNFMPVKSPCNLLQSWPQHQCLTLADLNTVLVGSCR